MKNTKYSVLLLYPPETVGGEFETYYAWVEALTTERAVELARWKVPSVHQHELAAEDMALLSVIEGHHDMLLGVNDDE